MFTNLWIVRIVVVPFTTAGIGFLVVVGAELLLRVVVHHVDLGQVDLLFFQNITARLSYNTVHVTYSGNVLAN